MVRWSWGYHVLLAPAESVEAEAEHTNGQIETGEYHDDPDDDSLLLGDGSRSRDTMVNSIVQESEQSPSGIQAKYASSTLSSSSSIARLHITKQVPDLLATPTTGMMKPREPHSVDEDDDGNEHIISFSSIRSATSDSPQEDPTGVKGIAFRYKRSATDIGERMEHFTLKQASALFARLPVSLRVALSTAGRGLRRFFRGVWALMNPPLWAMFAAIIVASVPALQHLFFSKGSFISNSVTRAITQSGGVAVPLILVVLGANLARNTLPLDPHHTMADDKEERKILMAALVSRMLLPTIIMAPILALAAKYVPISILDDPIFVIVCFLLTGAPSALQLAQICQINGVYMGVMSKLLFQSYVVWSVYDGNIWRLIANLT